MATEYNLSFMDDSHNIVDLFIGINLASNSLLAIMFLVVIWMIFVIMLYEIGIVDAIFFASFVSTVVAVLFLGLGMITTPIFAICLAMTLISGFMAYMK
jgi:hypothetical protein